MEKFDQIRVGSPLQAAFAALAAFLLPTLMLLPVKPAAPWPIGHGHALLGTLSIAGDKLFGTALVARVFTRTPPALLRMARRAPVRRLDALEGRAAGAPSALPRRGA
jgi:hypothetical protein